MAGKLLIVRGNSLSQEAVRAGGDLEGAVDLSDSSWDNLNDEWTLKVEDHANESVSEDDCEEAFPNDGLNECVGHRQAQSGAGFYQNRRIFSSAIRPSISPE
jgi:hypothetical protein